MNIDDIKVEPLVRKHEGMQPVTVWNDIRVTHLPTGLVVEVPHEFTRSQNESLKTAIAMLEAVVPNAAGCSTKQVCPPIPNAPVSGGTPSAQVACSAIRRCEDCAEMPDDGTCDKCGDSILTTKDAFVPNDQAHL